MQIKLAISNLEPKPARLHPQQWNMPYGVQEAIDGFKVRSCRECCSEGESHWPFSESCCNSFVESATQLR
jgi:hypothetical protein